MIIDTTSSFSPETSHASFPKKEKKKEREIDRDMEYYEDEIMDLCAQIPGISRNIFKLQFLMAVLPPQLCILSK